MKELYYCVAGHYFTLRTDNIEYVKKLLPSYIDFMCGESAGEASLFVLSVTERKLLRYNNRIDTFVIDGGQGLVCRGEKGYSFDLYENVSGRIIRFNTDASFKNAEISLSDLDVPAASFGLNNAVMIMYAFASSFHRTLLIHSSVVVHNDVAYMFLGKSGTGKSTHTRLWLENIDGTFLLNDDNPVIRVTDDNIMVYGSPWSGKTQCYRNESYRAGAFVRLSQKPYNRMTALRNAESYASLVSSCSIIRQDSAISRNIADTVSCIAGIVPGYILECLPDADAVMTACHNIVFPPYTCR